MGNFHLSICLYIVLAAFVLLSFKYYKIFFFLRPTSNTKQEEEATRIIPVASSDVSNVPHHESPNVPCHIDPLGFVSCYVLSSHVVSPS
jgi:hypothetical protein